VQHFYSQMPFPLLNQQHQTTNGNLCLLHMSVCYVLHTTCAT